MIVFSILLCDSARGRAYIQYLCRNNLFPNDVILMNNSRQQNYKNVACDNSFFNIHESVHTTVAKYGLNVVCCNTNDVNSDEIIAKIKESGGKFVIFGGPGSQILKSPILRAGKRILHVHPGIVQYYRGSTTIYYSMLMEKKAGCTAFFFNEYIDKGDVVITQEFPLLNNINIDYIYDPAIRAQTLILAIEKLKKDFSVCRQPEDDTNLPYFVIHPVLKHIAIMNNISRT